ncbi:hypothetical protein V1282_003511 [Nitrobacteraceae bacterium AZCC 2146]
MGTPVVMKWFRRHIKHGSRLALFALAMQLVPSFGHFHPIEAQATGLRADVASPATPAVASKAAVSSPQQRLPSHPGSDPNDYCEICADLALAGTALFSTPPVLELPQAIALLYEATDAEFVHLNSARVVFQPRAPPIS